MTDYSDIVYLLIYFGKRCKISATIGTYLVFFVAAMCFKTPTINLYGLYPRVYYLGCVTYSTL